MEHASARVIIITGASSGIGRALADVALRAGWDVVAVGRRQERLAELERSAIGTAGRIVTESIDLRAAGAPRAIVQKALTSFGRIDVLVNNAGGVAVGPISAQNEEALREQFETHLFAPLALVRESLVALRASRGQIFFVGSGVARIPVGGLGAYPSAKAAVRSAARIVRNELRADGIAVTYVDPGAVDTEFMTRAGLQGSPASVLASPEYVARRMFAATRTRHRVVNAVPWQTFVVAAGELLPDLTDYVLRRAPRLVGGGDSSHAALPTEAAELPAASTASAQPNDTRASDAAISREPTGNGVAATNDQQVRATNDTEGPATDDALEQALAPLARRMEKLKLRRDFVEKLLVPGTELEVGDVALRWAGMPNKNERAITTDVLDALAAAGLLSIIDNGRYRVIRNAHFGSGP